MKMKKYEVTFHFNNGDIKKYYIKAYLFQNKNFYNKCVKVIVILLHSFAMK